MAQELEQIQEAADYIRSCFSTNPNFSSSVGIVLGSGLGDFPTIMTKTAVIPYEKIPHMPKVTVASHHGQLICGYIEGERSPLVLCFSGRVHSYEGIPWQSVCFQVRLLASLGIKLYIVTNATGGMLDGMVPGCLCLLTDHFRYMARKDPLSEFQLPNEIVQNSKLSREYWDKEINAIVRRIAKEEGIELFEGSYVWTSGPSFETPMEVFSAKKLGGACVGMSTVPEVITAHAYGLSVLGISMVTNLAAGLSTTNLSHEEVYTNANDSILHLKRLLRSVLLNVEEYLAKHKEIPIFDKSSVRTITRRPFPKDSEQLREAVYETVKYIRKLSSNLSTQRAYVLCAPKVQADLAKKVQVSFLELSKFPIQSPGANYGQIIVNEHNELIILSADEEGFTIEESAFISLLFYELSIRHVSYLVHGYATGIENTEQSSGLTRIFDLFHFHDIIPPIHPYLIYLNDGSLGKRPFLFPYHINKKRSPSYMSFCGPSEPSHGEYKMAKSFGIHFIGTTSISPVYSSRYLGLNISIFLTQQDKDPKAPALSLSELLPQMREAPITERQEEPVFGKLNFNLLTQTIEQVEKLQIHYNDNISFEKLDNVAKEIVSQLDQVPQLALLDYNLNLISEMIERHNARIINKISLASELIGQDADFLLVEHENRNVFVVTLKTVGIDNTKQEEMRIDWSNYVRLLQHLKVKHIIFTQCFVSNNIDLLGKIINISDHANLTGSNPMIGPNIERYGPRFFDMSHVYTNIVASATDIPSVKCLLLPMVRNCRSLIEFNVARDIFGAQVVSSQAGKEAIVSQHCTLVEGFKCSMLGIIDEVVDVDTIEYLSKEASSEQKLKLLEVIFAHKQR